MTTYDRAFFHAFESSSITALSRFRVGYGPHPDLTGAGPALAGQYQWSAPDREPAPSAERGHIPSRAGRFVRWKGSGDLTSQALPGEAWVLAPFEQNVEPRVIEILERLLY